MKHVTCDMPNCDNVQDIPSTVNATRWMNMQITGYIPKEIKQYGGQLTFRKDICNECAVKLIKPEAEGVPSIKEQFEKIANEYLEDLAIDAIQAAQDNM